MTNQENREPRKIRRVHHRVLNRVKKLIKKSKRATLIKVLAATIAFSSSLSIKAMEPETKQHFNKVAKYTIQMQDAVNNQLNFQVGSEGFEQVETVVDSLKNLQSKELSMALEGYFKDTFNDFLERSSYQAENDIKELRKFAKEVGDGELQRGVDKWTTYMERAISARRVAKDLLSDANSNYDDFKKVDKNLKQAFKETKNYTVLDGYVSLVSMQVLEKSAKQLINDVYNERYDDLIDNIGVLQELFDKVPTETDVYKEFINKTKFSIVTKIMSNATHHIESGSEEVAIKEINLAKKVNKKITDYLMPTVLESMTKEIIRAAQSGNYEEAKEQIKLLDKKFDSKTAVKDVSVKIGNDLLKQAKDDFSRNNYKEAFDKLLEAEDFLGEQQKDLRKSMGHILKKKGQTELAKKFKEETSKKGFSKLKFWK